MTLSLVSISGVFEKIVDVVNAQILTEKVALHLRALKTFTDIYDHVIMSRCVVVGDGVVVLRTQSNYSPLVTAHHTSPLIITLQFTTTTLTLHRSHVNVTLQHSSPPHITLHRSSPPHITLHRSSLSTCLTLRSTTHHHHTLLITASHYTPPPHHYPTSHFTLITTHIIFHSLIITFSTHFPTSLPRHMHTHHYLTYTPPLIT